MKNENEILNRIVELQNDNKTIDANLKAISDSSEKGDAEVLEYQFLKRQKVANEQQIEALRWVRS